MVKDLIKEIESLSKEDLKDLLIKYDIPFVDTETGERYNMKKKLIALFGKSASGKDTVLNIVKNTYGELVNSVVSTTTRPKRDYEVEGKDYHFVSHEEFTRRLLSSSLVEALEFNNWWYGTEHHALSSERVNVGIYTIEGIHQLIENEDIDVVAVGIFASDKTRLIRSLKREENPNIDEILRRYKVDKIDFSLDEVKELQETGIPVHIYDNEEENHGHQIAAALGYLIKHHWTN